MKVYQNIKKITALSMLICMVFAFCSCNNSQTKSSKGNEQNTVVPEISMYDLQKAMLAADDNLPEMMTVNGSTENAAAQFAYVSDMDYSLINDFFIAYAKDGSLHADEIVVISVKDISSIKEAVDSLNAHVHDRENLYTQYGPEQVKRVQNAKVFSDGAFAVLIISNNSNAVKQAFQSFISKQS